VTTLERCSALPAALPFTTRPNVAGGVGAAVFAGRGVSGSGAEGPRFRAGSRRVRGPA
jgi:hypothetical protein